MESQGLLWPGPNSLSPSTLPRGPDAHCGQVGQGQHKVSRKGQISVSRVEGGARKNGRGREEVPGTPPSSREGAQGGKTRKPGLDSEPWGAEGLGRLGPILGGGRRLHPPSSGASHGLLSPTRERGRHRERERPFSPSLFTKLRAMPSSWTTIPRSPHLKNSEHAHLLTSVLAQRACSHLLSSPSGPFQPLLLPL